MLIICFMLLTRQQYDVLYDTLYIVCTLSRVSAFLRRTSSLPTVTVSSPQNCDTKGDDLYNALHIVTTSWCLFNFTIDMAHTFGKQQCFVFAVLVNWLLVSGLAVCIPRTMEVTTSSYCFPLGSSRRVAVRLMMWVSRQPCWIRSRPVFWLLGERRNERGTA
jgi:hypothetical protein